MSENKMVVLKERRRQRSDNPFEAICLQLAYVVDHGALHTSLIATEEGLLLAAPEDTEDEDASLLAAVAPMAWADRFDYDIDQTLRECGYEGAFLHIHEFWAFDQPLYLVTVSSQEVADEVSVHRSVRGIRRIARNAFAKSA